MMRISEKSELPNCIVIGAARCGTTSLHRYLGEHPEIYMCPLKETNYFAYEQETSTADSHAFTITSLDQYKTLFKPGIDYKVRGEASPRYLGCPQSAERIHQLIPDVKLVVSLRNPADRAFSGYQMAVRMSKKDLSVHDSLLDETSWWVNASFYYNNLRRYFDRFPQEHIHVIVFDDFARNAIGTMQELYRFLDVDYAFKPNVSRKYNTASVPKSAAIAALFRYTNKIFSPVTPAPLRELALQLRDKNLKPQPGPELPLEIRESLINLYHDDIMKVQDLIQHDLSEWVLIK